MPHLSILLSTILSLFTFMNCKKADLPIPIENDTKAATVEYVSEISLENLHLFASAFNLGSFFNYLNYGVRSYRVVYETTFQGKVISASGMLHIPVGLTKPAPLLSAQHGTTFKKSEAPSVSRSFSGMEYLTAAGYITLIPDYIGYGSSANVTHPYYDARHASMTVIDMIQSVKKYIKETNLVPINDQLFLAGYSEGGFVTLATQREIETDPSHDLRLSGVAAGAGGYDLLGMLKNISTTSYYSYPSYLAFIIQSFNSTYGWDKPLTYFFRTNFAEKLKTLLDGKSEGMYINSQLTTNMDSLFNPAFFQNLKGNGESQLKKALIKTSITDWKPRAPVRLFHGTNDDIIPYQNSQETLTKLKENGALDIELVLIHGGTHGSSLLPMMKSILPWFEKLSQDNSL